MSLNPSRRQDILHATLSLVAADGFDAVTMDAIAAASQSSKATLYRHWTSKANLVTEAVTTIPPRASDIADTGSLRTDLHEFIRQGFQRFDDISRLALALGHAASRHPELGRSLRENVVGAEDFGFEQLLRRAIGRGEEVGS